MKFSDYEKKISTKEVYDWESNYDFEVSHIITEARLRKGLTQKELADLIDTQQPSIARAESGASLPGHDLLKRIAKALNTCLLPPRLGHAFESENLSHNIFMDKNFDCPAFFSFTLAGKKNNTYENYQGCWEAKYDAFGTKEEPVSVENKLLNLNKI